MSIILTGTMGVGKSAVGRRVAARLNLPFVDLDRRIEERTGKTIPQLFTAGEEHFRHTEQQALAELDLRAPQVIATGGGTLIGARNRELVADATVIMLDAPPDVLRARLAGDGERPLAPQMLELYERRRALYARFPLRVQTEGRDVDAVADEVIRLAQSATSAPFTPARVELSPEIVVGRGVSALLGARVAALAPTGIAIITDETLAPLWGEQPRHDLLALGVPTTLITIPAGEAHKTLATVAILYDRLLAAEIDRGGTIVALGGGVIGDIAGFVAATWMRGVRGFVQLPTTLLAMVDASIGGKTGVDHPQGKNLIGAFRPADAILADPDFLTTLPAREWRSGLAEVIKHGVIGDPALFEHLRQQPPRPPAAEDAENVTDWLARAIRVKTEIVARDPYEQGERARLNLGHTFGHAYELLSGFALAHGEAVGIGMVTAARLSERVRLAPRGLAETISATLERVGLPTMWQDAPDAETILSAMQRDKKKAGKGIRYVLPRTIGDVTVTAPGEISDSDVLAALRDHLNIS